MQVLYNDKFEVDISNISVFIKICKIIIIIIIFVCVFIALLSYLSSYYGFLTYIAFKLGI